MYVDPPYPGNGCNYAHNMRDWESHHELAERLHKTKCKWILSSYDMPEIRELFARHYIISVQSASGMRVKKNDTSRVLNQEVLITNYKPPHHTPHGEVESQQLAVRSQHILHKQVYSGHPAHRPMKCSQHILHSWHDDLPKGDPSCRPTRKPLKLRRNSVTRL